MQRIAVPFTGWESHEFVRVAQALSQNGLSPPVKVFGREPITTTEVALAGTVVGASWDKYDRGIIVLSEDGRRYKVGGTNTTSSIACQVAIFTQVPLDFFGQLVTKSELQQLLEGPTPMAGDWSRLSTRLKLTLRVSELVQTIKQRFYMRTPHRLEELEDLLSVVEVQSANDLPDQETWDQLTTQLAYLIIDTADSAFKQQIAGILVLIATPRVLEPLCQLLEDPDVIVRREAALCFRAAEELLQRVAVEDPALARRCIETVTNALRKDEDSEVRVYAAEDLGYFANEIAVEALIETLERDEDEHARWATGVALARYEDPQRTFPALVSALGRDSSVMVQRSVMLGLGRILARIRAEPWELGSYQPQIDELQRLLHDRVQLLHQPALSSYAAYAVGELPNPSSALIGYLIEALHPETPFAVRSNATLSLSKLASQLLTLEEHTARVVKQLERNLSVQRPSDYPASAYFDWFLEYAGELLVKLEARELAARYYQKAANAFQHVPWRAMYYGGIAEYELAEYWFNEGDLAQAVASLDRAMALFRKIESAQSNAGSRSEKTKAGVEFRVNMAEARKAIIMAVSEWRSPLSAEEDSQFVTDMFKEAARRYMNVLRAEIEAETSVRNHQEQKRLTRTEVNLVRAIASLVSVGLRVEELSLAWAHSEDDDSLKRKLGQVDTEIEKFCAFASTTQSKSLLYSSSQFEELLEGVYSDMRTGLKPMTAIIGSLIWQIKQVFMKPLPTPAIECRIVGPGQADVDILLEGALYGTGSFEDPYLFPSSKRLVFRAVIEVIQRAKNEQLIFRDHNPPAGFAERSWIVHVHEGTFPISIDYGLLAPAKAANCFEFSLEFRNSGCSDPIYYERIWVRVYDPFSELQLEEEVIEQKIKSKEHTISKLKDEIRKTKLAIGEKPSMVGKVRVQELEDRVRQEEEELRQLRQKVQQQLQQ